MSSQQGIRLILTKISVASETFRCLRITWHHGKLQSPIHRVWMGVVCECLLSCFSQSNSLPPHRTVGSSVHGILQARTLEWVARALLRGIFPTQGSNPGLLGRLHWQAGSLPSTTWEAAMGWWFCLSHESRDYSNAAGPQTPL